MPPSRFTASYPASISADATASERAPVRQMATIRAVARQLGGPRRDLAERDPDRGGRVAGVPLVGLPDVEEQRALLHEAVALLRGHLGHGLGVHRRSWISGRGKDQPKLPGRHLG